MIDTGDLDNELSIVKCIKSLMGSKYGADNALAHQQIVISLTNSLVSPDLNTRKTVSEILTFLVHWDEWRGYQKVLDAMEIVKDQHHKASRFEFWIPAFQETIDTYTHLRGSDRKLDRSQVTETVFLEYCFSTTCLINMLVSAREDDLTVRCHIRAQLNACGIQRILSKLERFEYEVIDRQIERFRDDEAIDYEDLLQRGEKSQDYLPTVAEG
jgi:cytokinesis protein